MHGHGIANAIAKCGGANAAPMSAALAITSVATISLKVNMFPPWARRAILWLFLLLTFVRLLHLFSSVVAPAFGKSREK